MQDVNEREFAFLPLTIGIETLGGISTPLVLRGTPLPATRTQVFSTASDNQPSVEINILMGESPIAKRNISVAKFMLKEIPKMRRGEPQIQVTFQVDRKCRIAASALEKSTGKKVEIKDEDTRPYLSDERIQQLLGEAEKTRGEDELIIKSIEVKNRAKTAISKAESLLQKYQKDSNLGQQYHKIEQALAALGLVADTDNTEDIRVKVETLEKAISQSPISQGFDFQDIFGGGGFDSIFGSFAQTKPKSPTVGKGLRKEEPPTDKLKTRTTRTSGIGKIFGGGEFTLDPNLCFVLMPYEPELKAVCNDHVRPVVESEGLSCIRADEIVSTGFITWDIWEKINRCRFLIADLTRKNPNVFYELGIAHALGKDVILISQNTEDVPFDVRALRCIFYSFTPRGIKEMESTLRRTIREIMRSS
jgi:hypothetical protein